MAVLPGFLKKKRSTSQIGRSAEIAAARHLEASGYRIIRTNFRAGKGEIDIVAAHGDVLVFVEVKARASARFGTPFDAVDERKQRRIISAAKAYMARERVRDVAVRFDVVAVDLTPTPPAVEVLENAFHER